MFCALLMTRPITSAGSCCTESLLDRKKALYERNVRGFFHCHFSPGGSSYEDMIMMRTYLAFLLMPIAIAATAGSEMHADSTRLFDHVRFLTELQPARSHANLGSIERAAAYIENEFRKAGAVPESQHWQAGGKSYRNVIATYNPEGKRTLVIGAHYDVAGEQPGADDNASGVAGLIELAHLLFAEKPQLDHRIDLVAYCLEEPPYFGTNEMGSYIHAKSLHEANIDVIGMISLEMIGYFSDQPGSQPFPSPELAAIYPHTANFIIVVGIEEHAGFAGKVLALMAKNASIDTQMIVFPDGEGLAGLSDQRSYWRFGYPALMINDTAFIRNHNYHTKGDTIDTLDFAKMAAVVDGAYRAMVGLENDK